MTGTRLHSAFSLFRERYEEGYEGDAAEEYFLSIGNILQGNIDSLLTKEDALSVFSLFYDAYTAIEEDKIDFLDPEIFQTSFIEVAEKILEEATEEERTRIFHLLDPESAPIYLSETVRIVLLSAFDEPGLLSVLIERTLRKMKGTHLEDVRDHSAGVLTNLYERMGGRDEDITLLEMKYGDSTAFLVGKADIWRWRGDRRARALLTSLSENEEFVPLFRESRRDELEAFHEKYGR